MTAMYEVVCEFTEPLLGTVPKDPKLYETYLQSKTDAETDDELETVPDDPEAVGTGFHEHDGKPILYNYTIKGFFKDACSCLRRVPKTQSAALKAHKKVIDGLIFVEPRRIVIDTGGKELSRIERPLRAQTAQGDRVALARSDAAPPGSIITFQILALNVPEKLLREWLEYGALRGLGQWRNADYGRFSYEMHQVTSEGKAVCSEA
jgi:hypothetical protein